MRRDRAQPRRSAQPLDVVKLVGTQLDQPGLGPDQGRAGRRGIVGRGAGAGGVTAAAGQRQLQGEGHHEQDRLNLPGADEHVIIIDNAGHVRKLGSNLPRPALIAHADAGLPGNRAGDREQQSQSNRITSPPATRQA